MEDDVKKYSELKSKFDSLKGKRLQLETQLEEKNKQKTELEKEIKSKLPEGVSIEELPKYVETKKVEFSKMLDGFEAGLSGQVVTSVEVEDTDVVNEGDDQEVNFSEAPVEDDFDESIFG